MKIHIKAFEKELGDGKFKIKRHKALIIFNESNMLLINNLDLPLLIGDYRIINLDRNI